MAEKESLITEHPEKKNSKKEMAINTWTISLVFITSRGVDIAPVIAPAS